MRNATRPATGPVASERSTWRAVAIPSEHGGWGLTLEPVLLGLLVAWSVDGLLIGAAAFVAFLARTPAKLVAVDRRRDRWLPRTDLALRIAAIDLVVILALVALVTARAGWAWWLPVLVAAPLVGIEWSYDIRSHGRRLVPELCGAVGVAATSAAIAVVGGAPGRVATAAWLLLAARSIGAIPFVRAQIVLARRNELRVHGSDIAQVVAVLIATVTVVLERGALAGAIGVAAIAALHRIWSRRTPPPVKVIGVRQMVLGLALVIVAAVGLG